MRKTAFRMVVAALFLPAAIVSALRGARDGWGVEWRDARRYWRRGRP